MQAQSLVSLVARWMNAWKRVEPGSVPTSSVMAEAQGARTFVTLRSVQAGNARFKNATSAAASAASNASSGRQGPPKQGKVTVEAVIQARRVLLPGRRK